MEGKVGESVHTWPQSLPLITPQSYTAYQPFEYVSVPSLPGMGCPCTLQKVEGKQAKKLPAVLNTREWSSIPLEATAVQGRPFLPLGALSYRCFSCSTDGYEPTGSALGNRVPESPIQPKESGAKGRQQFYSWYWGNLIALQPFLKHFFQ